MFKPVLHTQPLKSVRQIKIGDVLRTFHGEDLFVTASWSTKKGVHVRADRYFEGKSTGTVNLDYDRGGDLTWVPGYERNGEETLWKRVRTTRDATWAHHVEMFYAEFGTGRYKARTWEITCDGENYGYAVTEEDAEVNFNLVRMGMRRDPSTGDYVPAKKEGA